jgi:hypothetical protein
MTKVSPLLHSDNIMIETPRVPEQTYRDINKTEAFNGSLISPAPTHYAIAPWQS